MDENKGRAAATSELSAGLDAKARRKRVREAVAHLQEYMRKYDAQPHYADYSDATIIDDVLYGLGVALHNKSAEFASGYDWFKREVLLPHLQASNAN